MIKKNDLEAAMQFATPRQAEYASEFIKLGSATAVGLKLGVDHSTISKALNSLLSKAASSGVSPSHDMTHQAAPGFRVKGVSTYYTEDGKPKGQWVKTTADSEQLAAMMRETVDALKEEIDPTSPVSAPLQCNASLLNLYVITDYHLGAMAWGEETGSDWDIKIAESLIVNWFGAAIAQAPSSEHAVFAQLGDFLHWDGLEAVTPTSKHTLDADTRYRKLVRVAIKVIKQIVKMLLVKHKKLTILMAEGNHDLAGSTWLSEIFAEFYSEEPRIDVITRPDPYYCVEHGLTSLFFHHGHKKKIQNLETVFIGKFREVFGRTKFSYGHTGHLHHKHVLETNTMIMEQHRTLASPDSHASRGGWLSGRDSQVITYHSKYGEVGRVIVSAEMVNDANS